MRASEMEREGITASYIPFMHARKRGTGSTVLGSWLAYGFSRFAAFLRLRQLHIAFMALI